MESEKEGLRARYRPTEVRLLFVGESPPAGGTFFYQVDTRLSHLYRATKRAFVAALAAVPAADEEFLQFFKGLGCYLEDLCLEPVNRLAPGERRRRQKDSAAGFGVRVKDLRPQAVVVVKTDIFRLVEEVLPTVGIGPPAGVHGLPFPAMGHQGTYIAGLAGLLRQFRTDGRV